MKDFLLEEIFLVEEKNNGGVNEPFIVTDGVEEFHTFHHPEDKKISDIDTDSSLGIKNILGQFSLSCVCVGVIGYLEPGHLVVCKYSRGNANITTNIPAIYTKRTLLLPIILNIPKI